METRAEKDSEREKQFVLFQAIAIFYSPISRSEPQQTLFSTETAVPNIKRQPFPESSLSLLTCSLLSVSDSINLPQAKAVIFPSSFSEMS
jgi:hypothetical protein